MPVYLTISVFFFKQKTAYEMRISDWSSDVCSSDLRRHQSSRSGADLARVARVLDTVALAARPRRRVVAVSPPDRSAAYRAACTSDSFRPGRRPTDFARWQGPAIRTATTPGDRKRVVSGKSVSERVDLGGRRIIKKKTKPKTISRN